MARSYRKGRLGEEIRKIISDLLLKGLRDPRLSGRMISVTDVEVSEDGSYAKVFLTVFGGSKNDETPEEMKKEVLDGMKKASGFIRRDIGQKIKIRHVPELTFQIDESMEYGRHMSKILDSLDIDMSDYGQEEDGYESIPEVLIEEDAGTGAVQEPIDLKDETDTERYKGQDPVFELKEDERTPYMDEIAKLLYESESMYIFPHMVADGDAIGSCVSLCTIMRSLGKTADILMEDEIPDNMKFLDKGYVTFVEGTEELPVRDLCIALDCSNIDRFPKRQRMFLECGKRTACIDHHVANVAFAEVSLIDYMAAACAELMYELYLYMGIDISKEAAEAIYTGIVTDTGNFQYTNTTRKTHLITSDLYLYGIDTKKINIIVYQSERPQKLRLHSDIMSRLEMFHDGLASMAYVTLQMYDDADAKTSESDGINSKIRDIQGVEVAVFLREKVKDTEIKVGMRSKDYIDVSAICSRFNGGGHVHAGGCTIYSTMDEAIALMRDAVNEALDEYDAKTK